MNGNEKRETRKVEVKNGETMVVVEMNTFITGRELRSIESALLDEMLVKQKTQNEQEVVMTGKMLVARQDAQIIAAVVSIDGQTDRIVDRVLDLPAPITQEIMQHVKELTESKKADAGN